MRRMGGWWVLLLLVATTSPAMVHSQILQELPFRDRGRDPYLSVADRQHAELDPLEVRLGSFLAAPSMDGGLGYDSNIYASERDRRSDVIATTAASLPVRSDWNRNAVAVGGEVTHRQYFRAGRESTTDYRLDADGRLDLFSGSAELALETARQTEARSEVDAPGAADRPVRYRRTGLSAVGDRPLGKLTVNLGIDWHRYRFEDARTIAGDPLPQRYRDRDIVTGLARVDLALGPALALYVDGTANRRSYDDVPTAGVARNSSGYTIEAGTDFDITRQVRGHVQAGYLAQINGANIWSVRGASGRGRIEWFAKPVVTVTVEGGRTIQDAAQSDTPAYISTDIAARVDYELFRSLILTVRADRAWDTFQGVDRRATRAQLSLEARYRMGRHVVYGLDYQHLSQRTPDPSDLRRFADNRVMLTIRLQR